MRNNKTVTVIDYGVGNLLSVSRGFEAVGANVVVTSSLGEIENAERLILPGVGAFGKGMQELKNHGFDKAIIEAISEGVPLLGICLGMQFLMETSNEFGSHEGLGLIPGNVISIPKQSLNGDTLTVPHIGWSALEVSSFHSSWHGTILESTKVGSHVYFVHSYMSNPSNSENLLAHCLYGENIISAVVLKDNIMGCQFHPEKSGSIGLEILEKFLTI